MFITNRRANKLRTEYENIRYFCYNICNEKGIHISDFKTFNLLVIYLFMDISHNDAVYAEWKSVLKRIMIYNSDVATAIGKIKLGSVKLPPIIVI